MLAGCAAWLLVEAALLLLIAIAVFAP